MKTEQDYQKAIHEVWDRYQEEKDRLRAYEEKLRKTWRQRLKDKEEEVRQDLQLEIRMRQQIINQQREEINKGKHWTDRTLLALVGVFLGLVIGLSL